MRRTTRLDQAGVGPVAYVAMAALGVILLTVAMATPNQNLDPTISLTEDQLINQTQLIRSRLLECATIYGSWPSGTSAVRSTLCPGAPVASQALWSGSEGRFLPAPPTGFGEWIYSDNGSTTTISVTTNSGQASASRLVGAKNAIAKLSATEALCSYTASTITWTVYLRFTATPSTATPCSAS